MASINFKSLKQNRKSSFDKLTNELTKMKQGPAGEASNEDNRFWKPDIDKAGNGYAIIRFLPAPEGEDIPFVRIWDHAFQGPGGWYIEKSLTTLNQADPVSEYNSKLWNSGIESNKALARKQKRNLKYFSNIYVVKDPSRPENEGKVFLFRYGKRIFDKLNEAMNPQFADEKAINPFDLWEGANFKLKIRNVDGYPNYDKSEFDKSAPLFDDEDEYESNLSNIHSLQELLAPKNFKSYDELKARFERAIGGAPQAAAGTIDEDDEDVAFPTPQKTAVAKEAPKQDSAPWNSDEDDEDLSFFKKLAKDD